MKVVILAGGLGTRIGEETAVRPKPMIEIGGMPIIWHIMKLYSYYGFNDFIICMGYKSYVIMDFFAHYYMHSSDMTIDLKDPLAREYHHPKSEPWKITMANTGADTMTGGRIKRVKDYIGNEPFLLTYGDGLSDVNIKNLVAFHKKNKNLLTVTAIQPGNRFGILNINENNKVEGFLEKPKEDGNFINGGFFVCEPEVIDYIDKDSTIFEQEPLTKIVKTGRFGAFKHKGFWHSMDTLRDKIHLEDLWKSENAPWKIWKD